jgi:hypothetical protein
MQQVSRSGVVGRNPSIYERGSKIQGYWVQSTNHKRQGFGYISTNPINIRQLGVRVSIDKPYKYTTGVRVYIDKPYKYTTGVRVSIDKPYKYTTGVRVSIDKPYKCTTGVRVSIDKPYKYTTARGSVACVHPETPIFFCF